MISSHIVFPRFPRFLWTRPTHLVRPVRTQLQPIIADMSTDIWSRRRHRGGATVKARKWERDKARAIARQSNITKARKCDSMYLSTPHVHSCFERTALQRRKQGAPSQSCTGFASTRRVEVSTDVHAPSIVLTQASVTSCRLLCLGCLWPRQRAVCTVF